MKKITQVNIEDATKRYAEALTNHTLLKRKVEKNDVELNKTHHEVVLAFQDLQALRFQN